jgi:hypothetical protein
MGELQRGLWIVKTEERYEPSFSYRWDLLDYWLEEQVLAARKLDRAKAVYRLVGKHIEVVHYSRADLIASLLTLPISEVTAGLDRVISERYAIPDQTVRGLPGRWISGACLTQACPQVLPTCKPFGSHFSTYDPDALISFNFRSPFSDTPRKPMASSILDSYVGVMSTSQEKKLPL